MYTLKDNEKKTSVMAYTEDALIYGEAVSTKIVRVNIWMRTDSAPKYVHLLNVQIVRPGNSVKTMKFDEMFMPTSELVAFHVAPGIEIDLDYEEGESNRMMQPVKVILGSFVVESVVRISTQTELGNSLEVGRTNWLSLYEAQISNPYLPQMNVPVEMLLVRPEKVGFGLMG